MNILEIETFLMVVKTGNISLAAKEIYVTQSTVSYRLKLLEDELSFKLLVRGKGSRKVELTNEGKDFLSIANQWISLWKDIQNIKNKHKIHNIVIGSVDSLNNHSFIPHYLNLIDSNKIKLDIRTHHSYEIQSLLENHTIDIGYVFGKTHNKNIITKHIYTEKMYLICHTDSPYYNKINLSELKRSDEVFLVWSSDFLQWHDHFWDIDEPPYINVNTGSMITNYLINNKNSWSIAPYSTIKFLQKNENLTYYETTPSTSKHECHQLIHKYPKGSRIKGINLFLELLDDYLKTCDWIDELM